MAFSAPAASAPENVRDTFRVKVPGASLFDEVRGDNRSKPMLRWLHGGPGAPERLLFRLLNNDLEASFVVAYLDQRGAGESFDKKDDPAALTIQRHVQGLDLVIDQLQERFGERPLLLVGHSWGGTLGILYAKTHPDRLLGLVAVAPLVHSWASRRAELEFAETHAIQRGDAETALRIDVLKSKTVLSDDQILCFSW